MAKNETTVMTMTGNCPASVTRLRSAVTAWVCLPALFLFAGAAALAQETVSPNAPEKFANSDCLACHLDPNTTRVVNGKTE
jgi:hypothetical protein